MAIDNLLAIGSAATAAFGYLGLGFAESAGIIESLNIIEKLGGAVGIGFVGFLIIRWLLKDRERIEKKLEQMHSERLAATERHQKELIDALKKTK